MNVGAVVVAAGRGLRLGADEPKALTRLAGATLVEHALAGLRAAGVDRLVVVHPPGHAEAFAGLVGDATLVPGGATRTASVRAGVVAVPAEVQLIAVHDAARALTPPEVVRATLGAVAGDVLAAAPGRPVADTLKRVTPSGEVQQVCATVAREDLVAVQTPQVFPREVLEAALASGLEAGDDLGLVEALVADGRLRGRVVLVAGAALGMKVTWPDDVVVAEALLEAAR